jgi:cyclomaltodextrinase / maltogenic alpha-amylase / neopullulanase
MISKTTSRNFLSSRLPGYLWCIILISIICSTNPSQAQNEIFGLAEPVQLELDTTVVMLEDYFIDVTKIKTIEAPGCFEFGLSNDKKRLILIAKDTVPLLSTIQITTDSGAYDILLKKSKKEKVVFQFNPNGKTYNKVSIVGDLTGWNPNIIFMELKNGIWQTELTLSPGRYQYQIVADGSWFLDPNNPVKIDNGIGGFNSLLVAGKRNNSDLKFSTYSVEIYYANQQKKEQIIPVPNANLAYFFWNNERLHVTWVYDEETYSERVILNIPNHATTLRRSYLRIFYEGTATATEDMLIPLEYGKIITDPSLLEKDDFQRTIMYFMMVDRFNNGNKNNDAPVQDTRLLPQANYYGGDLAGVQQKIDDGYFSNLGINSLWISPVFQNPYTAYQEFPEPHRWFSGYHGYWPISLSKVDSRLGTNTEFKQLVSGAHENNMSVYLDYVANHIHSEHPLWKSNPEFFSQLDLPDGRKNLRLWDEYRLTTWFEPYMPSFDHSKPIVAEACADSAMFWLKEFNLDGFRHDATKHIETEFWRLLTYKIKTEIEIPQNRNIYQIGETFGSRELISSYLGSGLLNAQFDFPLYFDARSVFANNEVGFDRLNTSLHESFDAYGYHHVMGNITGNHDMARFISYASGDLKWNENDKEAGWNRNITVTDTVGYAKLKMLHAFNMTIPGIPIIYYGDEIGMPGANDPDNRRMMRFDNLNPFEADVKNTVTKLTQLRSTHMALLYGDFEVLEVNETQYVYKRRYLNDVVIVVFNKSPEKTTIIVNDTIRNYPFEAQFGSNLVKTDNSIAVTLAPYSFEILTVNLK